MNKKHAIAYAQVTLDYMQSPKCESELNPDTFALEMKQAFRMYSQDSILEIADAQKYARRKLETLKNGCDADE
ncbi:MAG: hypothetical protein J6I85_06945 [Clostridia bacterium]|nr:hypothetical protein [Clostridia bacterium]MBP3801736.1 hypothetical protein [Clostridia bacterium]